MARESKLIVLDTPDGIDFAQLAAIKGAVGLELKGLRRSRGRSMYSIAKEKYGLKGSPKSVYQQLCQMVEDCIAQKHGN